MFTKETLQYLYEEEKMTDREIAEKYNCDRTTVIKNRQKFGIKTREFPHDVAVGEVVKKLKTDLSVSNLKIHSKMHKCDLLVNEKRVKVLSSNLTSEGRFVFTLTSKKENQNKESEYRTKLPNGRYKVDLPKVCDVLLCVGIDKEEIHYWLIPAGDLSDQLQTISIIPESATSKYVRYRENWSLLNKVSMKLVS